ncbi:protein-glutamate O-methyltransferase CheR [Hahella sp. SMD15-11]|uniref:Chemotaxis protein methyltransferase n=1 Tax=Thermohahella caldifontis TaxID=3142973 RepID=A0AB39UTB9_9GAMM
MGDTPDTGTRREFAFEWADFERLRALSQAHTGIVVPDAKYEMFYARLAKRLRALGLTSFRDYADYLEAHRETEFTPFINALTTNLTSFFREPHHFAYLRDQIVPAARAAGQSRLRVWSAGCSTGEEPWSIAITLAEANMPFELLATDIDSDVLDTARQGIYPLERLDGVDERIRKRWFLRGKGRQAGKARVRAELRERVAFQQLNLVRPFRHTEPFDVIFCRNVVIYFDKPTKMALIQRFAESLRPEGYLVMGHSESLHGLSNRFRPVGRTLYQKQGH